MAKVLVTGCSGRIGRAAVMALKDAGHYVVGIDVKPNSKVDEFHADAMQSSDIILKAAQNVDAIIHLAATPDDKCWPADPQVGDNFLSEIVPNNLISLYHALEAARIQKVPRLLLASSGQVVWDQTFDGPFPLTAETPPAPRYWYAAAKLMLEAIGRSYAINFRMSVIAVRLGWCPRDAQQEAEIATAQRHQDVYLSPYDAGQFFVKTVQSPPMPGQFHILYVCSRPRFQTRFDLTLTHQLCGYEPRDTWPHGVDYAR